MTRIFTIGHSTRSIEELLALLHEHRIQVVGDIRRFPYSRKFPHFGQDLLKERLSAENIGYRWYKDLGGFRKKTAQSSVNAALSSPGFRNYADYMSTGTFRAAALELVNGASTALTAVMCAERLFWKCHRRLLSDCLTGMGVEVVHIVDPGKTIIHTLTEGAVLIDEGVIYPTGGETL